MIPIELYKPFYFVVLSVLFFIFFMPNYLVKPLSEKSELTNQVILLGLLLLTICFIGLRDPMGSGKYLGDTKAYTETYLAIKNGKLVDFTKDAGFYYFMKICSYFLSVRFFYALCALIYVLLPYITFKKWFGNYTIYIFIVYVTAFSFLPFGINGLRNGLASAFFIYGLGLADRKWLRYAMFLLSVSFHMGMLLPVVAYFVTTKFSNPKKFLAVWLLAIPISYMLGGSLEDIVLKIFGENNFLHDERAMTYFSDESEIEKVANQFRIDFILYSSVAVFMGYWAIVKKGYDNKLYKKIYGLYVIANTVWIFLIYAPYTNRIAYLSWFIMPIIITAPFISDIKHSIPNNKRKLLYVMLGSIIFTILMEIK